METMNPSGLPQVATEYINSVIKAMKYRKKVRSEVRAELTAHFVDALADCQTDEDRQKAAEELIAEFGEVELLGKLLRRAKKRCRPLWQRVTFAVLKIIGLLFLLLLLRVGYMATGRPTISVDYTQWMNDKVRGGRDESLNAYHDYQKAIELMSKEMPPDIKKIFDYTHDQQKTPEDWQAIEAFLKTESEAINAFRTGAAKPYYWNIYKAPKDEKGQVAHGVVEGVLSQMSEYKKIALRMAVLQIPFDIYTDQIQQAVDDSFALCNLGQHLNQGVAAEQLVGVALESLAVGAVYDLLVQVEVSGKDLLRLQQIVEKSYDPDIAPADWSLEKAFWYDEIQRSFTDDGHGNGRPLPRGTLFTVGNQTDFVKGFITRFPDRKEAIANIDESFERFNEYRRLKPKTLHEMQALESLPVDKLMYMQQISEPAIRKVIQIGWRVRASQAGLIGTLAILRFEKENGQLPEDWEELHCKGYLKTIPMDPFSDKPLVYKKTEDGFILYSVGLNFTDDGGVPGTDKNGKPRMWGENGDEIFWPVKD
jgi:hypothetical protein